MIERALKAEVPFSWVAADEVYGGNPKLRSWLEEQQVRYVMAVKCREVITVPAGPRRADELAALVPAGGWQRLSWLRRTAARRAFSLTSRHASCCHLSTWLCRPPAGRGVTDAKVATEHRSPLKRERTSRPGLDPARSDAHHMRTTCGNRGC